MDHVTTDTLIVGASAAGLSCAAQLQNRGADFEIIEKHPHVGHAWRNHYQRLHLHTHKSASYLPFMKFAGHVSKYPSRSQVITYLEDYCSRLKNSPRFNTSAHQIDRTDQHWVTITNHGKIISKNLIVCTGNTNVPNKAIKPGMESFPGPIIHSSDYTNGERFSGQQVLVVGFGNSACEIAICLHEHGATPAMSVRSPVNVIPRDIMGIPVLKLATLFSKIPPRTADQINKPLMNFLIGNIERHGLRKLPYGPLEQIARDHSVPLLDIGTMDLIKRGLLKIYPDISNIEGDKVYFGDQAQPFDAIIMATGYNNGLEEFISLSSERLADIQLQWSKRKYFGKDGLYFCGYYVSPTGMLREINIESGYIANAIVQHDVAHR